MTCPNGHPLKVDLAAARRSPTLPCPRCGTTVKIHGRELDRELRKIERGIADIKIDIKL